MTLMLVWLLATVVWGVLVTTRMRTDFGLGARLGLGAGLGTALALWLPSVGSILFGLTWGSRVGALATLPLLAIELKRAKARATIAAEVRLAAAAFESPWTWLLLVGYVFLGFLLFYLFTEHSLRFRRDGAYSAGYSYNDMAFHATLANSFLKGANLWPPEYPPLAHHPLGYPFLPDLLAAVLTRLASSAPAAPAATPTLPPVNFLGPAFAISGTLACMTLVWLYFQLALRWSRSRLAATLAVLLLVVSGGFGALNLFARVSLGAAFQPTFFGTDFTFCRDIDVDYTNTLVGAFLPSRCALYGITLALVIVDLLSRAIERGLEARGELVTAGVVAGLIPLVHAHSVVALALLIGTWFFLSVTASAIRWVKSADLGPELRVLARWGYFVGPCVLIALPQIAWIEYYLSFNPPGGFSHFHFGWMAFEGVPDGLSFFEKGAVWIGYWIVNGGVFLLLVPVAFFFSPIRLKLLALPSFVLFAAANLLQLQPWVYDNIRLLTYAHFLAAVPVARFLARLARSSTTGAILAAELTVLSVFTGVCTIARETNVEFRLCGPEGVELAERLQETPASAVFLTAPTHTHPVSMLAGRRLALGAECWTYTHGVPYRDRIPKVHEIFKGGKDAVRFIDELGIDYVVVGPDERGSFSDLDESFLARLAKEPPIKSGPYSVYKVR